MSANNPPPERYTYAEAGVSIAYRAKPVVRERATYGLNHVGLDGVLRLFA